MEKIELDKIKPSLVNQRKLFDESKLDELSESIKSIGLINPILVKPVGDKYEIVCGERRYRACLKLNFKYICAIVKPSNEEKVVLAQFIENEQREDLMPIEIAKALKGLKLKFKCDDRTLSKKIGKSERWVSYALSILKLPRGIRYYFETGKLLLSHARPLYPLIGQEDLLDEVREKIKKGEFTVGSLYALVKRTNEKERIVEKPFVEPKRNFDLIIQEIKGLTDSEKIHKLLDEICEIHKLKILSLRKALMVKIQKLRKLKAKESNE